MSGPGRPGLTRGGVVAAALALTGVRPAGSAAFDAGNTAVSLTPPEGTYVNSVAANTTCNDNQLASRGATPHPGRLRFQLPAASAGQRPGNVRLGLRTSSDPTAGPVGSHLPVPATGAGAGSAVTYDSRPSLAPTVPGTISGASRSTGHSVERDAPDPGGALGPAYSSAPAGDGADSLRIRPGDVATAAHGPQLVLTFGAE
ncbi:hypothetical protein [Streptomyces sp. NPDC088115]|uniref:hypothetical protein n=1 Tax=Streptomyces sp. NPDC088115 TaxID=3365824 RepID=UPI003826D701